MIRWLYRLLTGPARRRAAERAAERIVRDHQRTIEREARVGALVAPYYDRIAADAQRRIEALPSDLDDEARLIAQVEILAEAIGKMMTVGLRFRALLRGRW